MIHTTISLHNEWLPVTNASELDSRRLVGVRVASVDLVVWRDSSGEAHVWLDRCPHRGAKLSLGRVDGDVLVCGYHGWNYASGGQCVRMPSHPTLQPPSGACAKIYPSKEKYGVVWVCLGTPARELDVFPEYYGAYPHVRKLHLKPQVVQTSGPRLIENFLDMAHFPFVHTGTLGQEPYTEVLDYEVEYTKRGPVATNCLFWQPGGVPALKAGAQIEYKYSVRGPMLATLTKFPSKDAAKRDGAMHILLAISPVDECQIRAWLVSVFENDPRSSEKELHDFNLNIFMEDVPMVESQQPRWLPLDGAAEVHQRCDRMAVSYRRWLEEIGWGYGTSLGAAAKAAQIQAA